MVSRDEQILFLSQQAPSHHVAIPCALQPIVFPDVASALLSRDAVYRDDEGAVARDGVGCHSDSGAFALKDVPWQFNEVSSEVDEFPFEVLHGPSRPDATPCGCVACPCADDEGVFHPEIEDSADDDRAFVADARLCGLVEPGFLDDDEPWLDVANPCRLEEGGFPHDARPFRADASLCGLDEVGNRPDEGAFAPKRTV
jgi:hypothetical protein